MAETVVSLTLESLSELIKSESKFLSGVRDEVQEIHKEFEWMQCFLHDVDARKNQEQLLQKWVQDIRSLAYRAQNTIEMYAIEVSSRRGRGIKIVFKRFACILSDAIALHKVGAEITNIKAAINRLRERLQTFNVQAFNRGEGTRLGNEKQRLLRKTYGHQVEDYFVGMKDDMRDLVSLIKDEDRSHRVVSIWGMGGAGKTTIAQKIYNRDDIRGHFNAFAWVCITQECQIQTVFQDILKQLSPSATRRQEISSMAEEQVVGELYQLQKEKKCLIVIDDIWKLEDWRCLQPALPVDASGSKILLTTRVREVAEVGYLHELQSLKEDEALELLRMKAHIEDLSDPELEPLGMEMVHKCGNHPLAVSVLGGILSGKNSVSDWKKVNDNVDAYLKGSEQSKEGHSIISQVLELSYNELPYHLKPCFLYMASFGEDKFIVSELLCLMWMAEGIVLPKHRLRDESLMDVAERYLGELADRSMVQVGIPDRLTARKFISCGLHDLMRELCLEKAKEEEFLEVKGIQRESVNMTCLNSYAHRLVINIKDSQDARLNYDEGIEVSRQLRSLFLSTDGADFEFPKKPSHWFGKFKFLRLLLFLAVEFPVTGIPKEIGKLIHLRLFFLNTYGVTKLPSAIGDLPYLENLWFASGIEMPDVLWKLKRLTHLYFPSPYGFQNSDAADLIWESTMWVGSPYFGDHVQIKGKDKLRLHGLGDRLEVLSWFNSTTMEASDLSQLTKLQIFSAWVNETHSLSLVMNSIEVDFVRLKEAQLQIECDFAASVEGLNLLRKVLICRKLQSLRIIGYIGKLPNYESNFLQNLNMLELYKSHIEEDPMQMLEMLPSLQSLVLSFNAYVGKEMCCRAMGFPKLKYLRVQYLDNLEKWSIEEGAMPSLLSLTIRQCWELARIPNGLRFIRTLSILDILEMPEDFKERVHQEGVDLDEVRHIPSVVI